MYAPSHRLFLPLNVKPMIAELAFAWTVLKETHKTHLRNQKPEKKKKNLPKKIDIKIKTMKKKPVKLDESPEVPSGVYKSSMQKSLYRL